MTHFRRDPIAPDRLSPMQVAQAALPPIPGMDPDFIAEHRRYGFPWCDTCKAPATTSEHFGVLHVTPERPTGLFHNNDPAGHEATICEWWAI